MAGLLPSWDPRKISIALASIWTLRKTIEKAKKESQTASSDPGHFSNSGLFLAEERENLLSAFFLRIMLWLEMIIAQQNGKDPIFFLALLKLISAIGLGVTAFIIGYPIFSSISLAFFVTASPVTIVAAIASLIVLLTGFSLFLQSMREVAFWSKPKETEESKYKAALKAARKNRSTLQKLRLSGAFWLLSALASLVVGAAVLYLIVPLLTHLTLSLMTLLMLPLLVAGLVYGVFCLRRSYLNLSLGYRLYQESRRRKAGTTKYAYILENGKLRLMPFFPNKDRQVKLNNLLFTQDKRLSAEQIRQLKEAKALSLFETFHKVKGADKLAGLAEQGLAALRGVLRNEPENAVELEDRKNENVDVDSEADDAPSAHTKAGRLYQTEMLLKDLFDNDAALLKFLGDSSLKDNPDEYAKFARKLLEHYPTSIQAGVEAVGKPSEVTLRVHETIELPELGHALSVEEQRILRIMIKNNEHEARKAEKPKGKKHKKEQVHAQAQEAAQETGTIDPDLFDREIKAQREDEVGRASPDQKVDIKAKYKKFKKLVFPNKEARGSVSYRRLRTVNSSKQENQITTSLRLISPNVAGLGMLMDSRYQLLILKVLDAADAKLRKDKKTDAQYIQNFKAAALEILLNYNAAVLEAICLEYKGIDADTPALTAFIDNLVARTVATDRPVRELDGFRVEEEDPDAALKVAFQQIGNPARSIGFTTRLSEAHIKTINASKTFQDTKGHDDQITRGRLSQLEAIFEEKDAKAASPEEDEAKRLQQAVVFTCLLGNLEAFHYLKKKYNQEQFTEFLALLRELLESDVGSNMSLLRLSLAPDRLENLQTFKERTVEAFKKTNKQDEIKERLSNFMNQIATSKKAIAPKIKGGAKAQAVVPENLVQQEVRKALKETLLNREVIKVLSEYSSEEFEEFMKTLREFLLREDVKNNPEAIRTVITAENLRPTENLSGIHNFKLKAVAAGKIAGSYKYYLSEASVIVRAPNDQAEPIKEGRLFLVTHKKELSQELIELINTPKFKSLLKMLQTLSPDQKKDEIINSMTNRLLVVLLTPPGEAMSILNAENYDVEKFKKLLKKYLKASASAITLAHAEKGEEFRALLNTPMNEHNKAKYEELKTLLKTYISPENIRNYAGDLQQFEELINELEKANKKNKALKKAEEQEAKRLEDVAAQEPAEEFKEPEATQTYDYYFSNNKVVVRKPGDTSPVEDGRLFLSIPKEQAQLDLDLILQINTPKFKPLLTRLNAFLTNPKGYQVGKRMTTQLLVRLLTAPGEIMAVLQAQARKSPQDQHIEQFAELLKSYLQACSSILAQTKPEKREEVRKNHLAAINENCASDLDVFRSLIAAMEQKQPSPKGQEKSPHNWSGFWSKKPKDPSKQPLLANQAQSPRPGAAPPSGDKE